MHYSWTTLCSLCQHLYDVTVIKKGVTNKAGVMRAKKVAHQSSDDKDISNIIRCSYKVLDIYADTRMCKSDKK